jgi:drug/metabolite transporter (DMT)-like permease
MLFAIILILGGSILSEVSSSLGKYTVNHKVVGLFSLGFFNCVIGFGLFAGMIAFQPDAWKFSMASLPILAVRVVLDCLQLFWTLKATAAATRGTFGLVRSATIPLVLMIDLLLGYTLGPWMLVGMGLIFSTLVVLAALGDLDGKGMKYLALSAVNAAITISLFKFNITHYNSVATEQVIVLFCMSLVFLILARIKRESVIKTFRHPLLAAEGVSLGGAGLLDSFAYTFIPASVAVTMIRALSVFWSIVFGKAYFKETHFVPKLAGCIVIVLGIILLAR